MTDHTFAQLSYEIASEIGQDVDYVRTKSDTSGERLYMTGVELGVLLGTAAAMAFLTGVVKGTATTIGETTGKALGKMLLAKLDALLGRAKQVNQQDVPAVNAELEALHADLDGLLREELLLVVSKRVYLAERPTVEGTARAEVRATLMSFGLPTERAEGHAAAITVLSSTALIEILK